MPYADKHKSKQDILTTEIAISSAGTDQQLIAGVAGKAIRVLGFILSQDGTAKTDVKLNFDGGAVVARVGLEAIGSPVSVNFGGKDGILGEDGTDLDYTIAGLTAGDVLGVVYYTLEEV